jgi:protein SCO1/2
MHLRVFALISLLLVSAACGGAKRYEMKGQVLAVNRDKVEILVKHEDIVGLMPAMTMPYKVESVSMLDNLGPGDLITTELEVDDNQGVITRITKTGTAKPDVPAPAGPAKSGFELIRPGADVPNQMFIDQEGRKRPFSDIRRGRAVALTFIYTKCPMPTFCPMMDRHFVEVQEHIDAKRLGDRIHLLSISFDPKNDTPPVLKTHAQSLGVDPSLWTFVTGDRDEIDRLAMQFGVTLIRGEASDPDEIGHSLRTAIVDRHGKLVKVYTGNEWTPAELVADIEKLP